MLALACISSGKASACTCADTPAETQTLSTQTPASTFAEKSPEICGCGVIVSPMSTLPRMYADATESSPTFKLMLSPPPIESPASESMTYIFASAINRCPSIRGPCCFPASMCHGPLGPKWMSTAALFALLPISTDASPPMKFRCPHSRPSKLLPAYWKYPLLLPGVDVQRTARPAMDVNRRVVRAVAHIHRCQAAHEVQMSPQSPIKIATRVLEISLEISVAVVRRLEHPGVEIHARARILPTRLDHQIAVQRVSKLVGHPPPHSRHE